jgi:fucose permease
MITTRKKQSNRAEGLPLIERPSSVCPKTSRSLILAETIVMYLLMSSIAIFVALIGIIMTRLLDEFSMPFSQGGEFAGMLNTGCFFGILLSGILLDSLDMRKLLATLFVLFEILLFAVNRASSYIMFLILLFISGMVTKLLDVSLNAQVSFLHEKNKGFYMNLLHFSYGLGFLSGPVFSETLFKFGFAWRSLYLVLAVICFVFLVLYCLVISKNKSQTLKSREEKTTATFRSILQPRMVFLFLILFFYCGHQHGISNWLPAYMTKTFGTDGMNAGIALSLFWLGIVLSRLACSFLTRIVSEKLILTVSCALGAAILFAGVALRSETLMFIASIGSGIFAGATIPMVITMGYRWYPFAQGKVSTFLFIAVSLGGALFPWLMGYVEPVFGLQFSMAANSVLLFFAAALAFFTPE